MVGWQFFQDRYAIDIYGRLIIIVIFISSKQLETRLAEKEEQLLEKDLIFEQVERLVGRIRNKAEVGKDDTLNLAKSVRKCLSYHSFLRYNYKFLFINLVSLYIFVIVSFKNIIFVNVGI